MQLIPPTRICNELSRSVWPKNTEIRYLNNSDPEQNKEDAKDEWLDAVNTLSRVRVSRIEYVNQRGLFCITTFTPNHPNPMGIKPPSPNGDKTPTPNGDKTTHFSCSIFRQVSLDPSPATCLMAELILTNEFFLLIRLRKGYYGPLFISSCLIELQDRRPYIYISVISIQKAESN